MWFAWEWAGAESSHSVSYQTVPLLISDLASNFPFLLLYSGCTSNTTIRFWCLHLMVHGPLLCFLEHSQLKKVTEEERRDQKKPQYWCRDALGGLFGQGPETCPFHLWSFFLIKSKCSSLECIHLKCWIVKISYVLRNTLKECCCI